jgi:F-type H+-transporting ATPase subunit gamma
MTLEQLQQSRHAVQTIHDVTSAMRAIAAGRMHGAQQALESTHRYNEVVVRASGTVLAELAAVPQRVTGQRTGLLVMTSEQPLCGPLNQNVLALAERRWHELRQTGPVYLVVAGQRGLRDLAARGIMPESGEPATTSLRGLRDLVKRLAAVLAGRYAAGDLDTLRVIYSRYVSVSEQVPTEEQILPPDLAAIRHGASLEAHTYQRYLAPAPLLAGLLGEYAFITLYRIAVEAFTSEQASRLVAMDAATHNTDRMLESLRDLERRERQGEITRQVLELIGARVAANPATPASPTA